MCLCLCVHNFLAAQYFCKTSLGWGEEMQPCRCCWAVIVISLSQHSQEWEMVRVAIWQHLEDDMVPVLDIGIWFWRTECDQTLLHFNKVPKAMSQLPFLCRACDGLFFLQDEPFTEWKHFLGMLDMLCAPAQGWFLATRTPLAYQALPFVFWPQVDDNVASLVIAQLLFLQSESNKKPIHMYINSPGECRQEARTA